MPGCVYHPLQRHPLSYSLRMWAVLSSKWKLKYFAHGRGFRCQTTQNLNNFGDIVLLLHEKAKKCTKF